ncbi:WD40-repeat-containing domain protein [Cristinia sonorae]|uniref:WD40-repeat-containing domain protein n=1 Tax=Cristinia sonorae TaxID=1940300 RepID=A0A8K0UI41_9AGAR|nr:WD40-repeat-containing domain protein [Cristinia sonorae]
MAPASLQKSSTLLTPYKLYEGSNAEVTIGHFQLRDVLTCRGEHGVVYYPQERSIVEHDLATNRPRILTEVAFPLVSLSSLNISETDETLFAAGGFDGEIHLSVYSNSSSPVDNEESDDPDRFPTLGLGRQRWRSETIPEAMSYLNNSIILYSQGSNTEPRAVVNDNSNTVTFFDVATRAMGETEYTIQDDPADTKATQRLCEVGELQLDAPVNHSSISPDGRTLLSVGDSQYVYLHQISGSSHVSFTPTSTLSLSNYHHIRPGAPVIDPASFSSAFSSDGSKFAVASQEGFVTVWDTRSTRPLKIYQTGKMARSGSAGQKLETPGWSMGGGCQWSARNVKFSPAGARREVMVFTEHTSLFHVVDARTFETVETFCVPDFEDNGNGNTHLDKNVDGDHIVGPVASPSEQDIAGMCIDPAGELVYVAATNGISTWKVTGSD